jgi:hypothetical protein
MSGIYGPYQLTGSENAITGEWNAGTVAAIGSGLAISNQTLAAQWSGGSVAAIGSGLTITAGNTLQTTFTEQWNAGTVNAIGTGLILSGNTLAATASSQQWNAGTVTSIGGGLQLSAGVLGATGQQFYNVAAGVPSLSSFTQVGIAGTTSIAQSTGKIISIKDTGGNAFDLRGLVYTAPSTPYRIAILVCNTQPTSTSTARALCWGFSDGTKYQVLYCEANGGANIYLVNFSNSTTEVNATPITNVNPLQYGSVIWLGLRSDGTNIYFEYSSDGVNFITIYSTLISTNYITTIADVFIGISPQSATSASALSIQCFDPNGLNRAFA